MLVLFAAPTGSSESHAFPRARATKAGPMTDHDEAARRGRQPARAVPHLSARTQGIRFASRIDRNGYRNSQTVPAMIVRTVSGAPTRK